MTTHPASTASETSTRGACTSAAREASVLVGHNTGAIREQTAALLEAIREARALPPPQPQEAPKPKTRAERMPPPDALLLTLDEAAALLGISERTFKRHVAPRLKPRRVGSLTRWARAEVVRFVQERGDGE